MVVRRRRQVPSPAPPPAPGEVLFREGAFSYFRDGLGPRDGKYAPARFKAVFAADPGGCYGFGDTKAQAEAMLRRYAALHGPGD